MGFTSNIVVGVWFGNDDDSPMKKITGGTAPAILWGDFMKKAHLNIQPRELNYGYKSQESIEKNRKRIEKIIEKSRKKPKKNVFESIIENFF